MLGHLLLGTSAMALLVASESTFHRSYHILATYDPDSRACHVIDRGPTQLRRDLDSTEVVAEFRRRVIDHHGGPRVALEGGDWLMDVVGQDSRQVERMLSEKCNVTVWEQEPEPERTGGRFVWQGLGTENGQEGGKVDETEVRNIVHNGSPENRIDVVFMGDGYTVAEKTKFFDDIKRLTRDMFVGQTYRSTLPLFNIWAVYLPSAESGIGVGGQPRNTAFGLYRDGTELRGIYCSKVRAARAACKLTGRSACDFPSLIGNDPYYGGLGGEFTISTSSQTSGTVVLRHEMGHNFIDVGEEYDGGYVYSGCNAARNLDSLGWKHWLTSPLREERNVLRVQDYAWYNLGKGPYRIPFRSDGRWARWYMQFSASGVETEGSLEVFLDGNPLPWQTSGTLDRAFSSWFEQDRGLDAGEHVLEFRQAFPPANASSPIRQLCSVTLHEYPGEDEYVFDNKHVSAYPSISLDGRRTFRPTNEGCLMRNMTQPTLCPVCQEGLWHQLLKTVTLNEGVIVVQCVPGDADKVWVKLFAIPVAQLRSPETRVDGERYYIAWYREGVRQSVLDDKFWFVREAEEALGKWMVRLEFVTPEVKTDPKGLLVGKQEFRVWKRECSGMVEKETFRNW